MMTVSQFLEYDAWATAKLLESTTALSSEQFVHEFAGPLSSVRQQFFHLLSVADRYRARLAHEAVPDAAPESLATPQDLVLYESQVRSRLNDFINNLVEDELGQVQEHQTRRGPFRASLEQTLTHLVNHGTYHRGQVACLLKLHGIDFQDTDFIIWLNQEEKY